MRLEALNHSQLVAEQDRISRAIPRLTEVADKLGTDEGPEPYRYSLADGLDLVERINHVGTLRFRIRTIALPAFERRQQTVEGLITGYPQRLQEAEDTFAKMQTAPEGQYTPMELSLAEQALKMAREEFHTPAIKELAAEVTAPPITTPTPKPFKHLRILPGMEVASLVILGENDYLGGRRLKLTEAEFMALNALIRAQVLEQRRLTPAQLANQAFGKTPSEVGLNKIMRQLRDQLNLPGYQFIDSTGAKRGPTVRYGIAEDVFIKDESLQQEKARVERLGALRRLVIERKGTPMSALFEQLTINLGGQVQLDSSYREKIHKIRVKLAHIVIDGFKYEIKTFKTRGRGLSYSLVEIPVPIPPPAPKGVDEEEESREGAVVGSVVVAPVLPPVTEAPAVFPPKLPKEPRLKDPFEQIKRRDPEVVGKIETIANMVIAAGRPFFIVPEIEDLFKVPDHQVEKAIEERRVKPVWVEGHHGYLSPVDVVCLKAVTDYRNNLTKPERRQLRRLVRETFNRVLGKQNHESREKS